MKLFWAIFMVLNAISILILVGVIIWASFDVHERIGWVLVAQGPPIIMMGIRRGFMR